jgi:hypothetical protein
MTLAAGALLGASALGAQTVAAARDSIHAGAYQPAIAMLSRVPRGDTSWI